ncbi:allantoinase AllB [Flavisolibacter ginsenosidimutans]|uniref:allantoinase n=1 Tax=Flavisolibacter ginsenosidimutans TaxID=661481 RepID=A0A5B8UMV0_9BACT|nr:allantoinase AllB [Flavisolibacter ginsenosidimutans]QEC58007.1 allantoinase AllB [Flavisolibacter ginsenosidimutans]
MNEFILHSKRVITPNGEAEAFVWVKDSVIKNVNKNRPEAAIEMLECGNDVVMSGVIDPHVHINEPGRTEWEGFDTATKAAIAGGVTTLVDMPLNSSPVTTTAKAFEDKIEAARKNLHTNCGFWGGIVPSNEKEIEPLIEKGVLGFKAFLTHSGIDDFPNVTEYDLRKAMPIIAKHNLPLLVHCELTDDRGGMTRDRRSYKEYVASRPKQWEDDAIALMIRLCEEFNCRTHIVHLSSADSIEQIKKAKEKRLPLTVETAQHYLFFCAEEIADGATAFKCAPPIRERENNEQLWGALKEGVIDFVATDHSPATPELKELQSGDFTKAWGGIASIQFALPVLWTAAKQRGITPNDICRWLSSNPAKLIGQQTRKGEIAEGYDADLIVWNPEESFVVTEDIIHHKHKVTPYLGRELFGVVKQTYLNGTMVFDKGKMQLNCGHIIKHNSHE